MRNISTNTGILLAAVLLSMCTSGDKKIKEAPTIDNTNFAALKIAGAISCTAGMSEKDSTLFMQGGGELFQPTVENNKKPVETTVTGMVWIPGGEFSMGGVNPVGMLDGGNDNMN